MPGSATPQSRQALASIQAAFNTFQKTVTKNDARQFHSTELKDVWTAAKDVEKRLAAKQQSRNLAKMQPFLDGLEHYSKAVEVLCNGTPYLPWIWAPIKLCLIIASDHIDAFEKLIKAYGDISEALPRFSLLEQSLNGNQDFQQVLALFYCDILEFHRRAYLLFTQNAWKRFFDTAWKRFDLHFGAVLESLRKHADLVDREANAFSIATIFQVRQKIYDDAAMRDKQRLEAQVQSVLAWLDARDRAHDDDFHRLDQRCCLGTSNWLWSHKTVELWVRRGPQRPRLWVCGKPGSGKSVLSVQLVQHLRAKGDCTVAYHLCNFRFGPRNDCSAFLRGIASQIIRQNIDVAALVYEDYVSKGKEPSMVNLKALVTTMISGIPETRLIIDGLDESSPEEQKMILKTAFAVADGKSPSSHCKVVVFSRNLAAIARMFKKEDQLNLTKEPDAVNNSIRAFVKDELAKFEREQEELSVTEAMLRDLESQMVEKADGMFLWAHLVLATLDEVHSLYELKRIVDRLPKGLYEAYARVLQHITTSLPSDKSSQAKSIFSWVALAETPLNVHEILNGLAYSNAPYALNESTKLTQAVLNLGKPLVEVAQNGTVSFVHFSVKEYLLDKETGPFISQSLALRDVLLASSLSLFDSLDLVDPNVPDELRISRVAQGFYDLHGYAACHWISFIQQYLTARTATEAFASDQLNIVFQRLGARHSLLYQQQSHSTTTTPTPVPETFRSLCIHEGFLSLASLCLKEASREVDKANLARDTTNLDQSSSACISLLSEATKYIQTATESLVGQSAPVLYPYIDATILDQFRRRHGATAYTCRMLNCSAGFSQQDQRDQHEKDHTPRLWCTESTCQFATTIGFRTPKDLKKHLKTYHEPRSFPIPLFRSFSHHTPAVVSATALNETAHPPDYQIQLMLLEQHSKKRIMMAQLEQDSMAKQEGTTLSSEQGSLRLGTLTHAQPDHRNHMLIGPNGHPMIRPLSSSSSSAPWLNPQPTTLMHMQEKTPHQQAATIATPQSEPMKLSGGELAQSGMIHAPLFLKLNEKMLTDPDVQLTMPSTSSHIFEQDLYGKIIDNMWEGLKGWASDSWQAKFPIQDRAHRLMALIFVLQDTNANIDQCTNIAERWELRTISDSANMVDYISSMDRKIQEILSRRQAALSRLQPRFTNPWVSASQTSSTIAAVYEPVGLCK